MAGRVDGEKRVRSAFEGSGFELTNFGTQGVRWSRSSLPRRSRPRRCRMSRPSEKASLGQGLHCPEGQGTPITAIGVERIPLTAHEQANQEAVWHWFSLLPVDKRSVVVSVQDEYWVSLLLDMCRLRRRASRGTLRGGGASNRGQGTSSAPAAPAHRRAPQAYFSSTTSTLASPPRAACTGAWRRRRRRRAYRALTDRRRPRLAATAAPRTRACSDTAGPRQKC